MHSSRRQTRLAKVIHEGPQPGVALYEHTEVTVVVTIMAHKVTGESLYERTLRATVEGPETLRMKGEQPLAEDEMQLRLHAYEILAEAAALLLAGDAQEVSLPFKVGNVIDFSSHSSVSFVC